MAGEGFQVTGRRVLFALGERADENNALQPTDDVSPDDRRFVMFQRVDSTAATLSATVVRTSRVR